MVRRLTHEEVEKAFNDRGWKLLSIYENSKQLLDFECYKGHKHRISYTNFQKGQSCGYCTGRIITQEQVEKAFNDRGWKLLSIYENSKQLLDFECYKGHKHRISYDKFQKGVGCAYCSNEIKGLNQRFSQEQVEKAFNDRGWKLLSTYKNANSLLDFECDKGHKHQIRYGTFQQGRGCAYCSNEIKGLNQRFSQEQVEKAFNDRGWKLLSQYESIKDLLDFQCDKGHKHQISYDNLQRGIGCGKCFEESIKGCLTVTAYRIYKRVKKKSTITEEILLDICRILVSKELQAFYNNCPKGHHVDHVVPFSWFNHNEIEQIKACWSIDNLQYLPALQNIKKRDKLSLRLIKKLNKKQRSILTLASNKPLKIAYYMLSVVV